MASDRGEMPPPFSIGRGRARRPGSSQTATTEAPPVGPRAIVGARRDSPDHGGVEHARGTGRGFFTNKHIRPMHPGTEQEVLNDAMSRVIVRDESSRSTSLSSLSLSSTQDEAGQFDSADLQQPVELRSGESTFALPDTSVPPPGLVNQNLMGYNNVPPPQPWSTFSPSNETYPSPVLNDAYVPPPQHSLMHHLPNMPGSSNFQISFSNQEAVNNDSFVQAQSQAIIPGFQNLQVSLNNVDDSQRQVYTMNSDPAQANYQSIEQDPNHSVPTQPEMVSSQPSWNINAAEFVPMLTTEFVPSDSYEQQIPQSWSTGENGVPEPSYLHNSAEVEYADMNLIQHSNNGYGDAGISVVPSFIHKIPPGLTEVTTDDAINVLKATLARLIQMPGNMDEVVRDLNDNLDLFIKKKETMTEMVNIIFELVVDQCPFAYTAAKLCNHLFALSPHQDFDGDWNFLNVLMTRVQQLVKERSTMNPDRLRGFILFIAELYPNCTIDNSEHRIDKFGDILVFIIKEIFRERFHETELLKTAIKALKCNGAYLDDRDKNDEKNRMDDVYKAVAKVGEECVDPTVRLMAQKLLEFRTMDWGRQEDATPTPMPTVQPMTSAEPVFYSSDGQCLSRAEAGFDHPDPTAEFIASGFAPDDDLDDPEEYDSAYQEFLQSTGQTM